MITTVCSKFYKYLLNTGINWCDRVGQRIPDVKPFSNLVQLGSIFLYCVPGVRGYHWGTQELDNRISILLLLGVFCLHLVTAMLV